MLSPLLWGHSPTLCMAPDPKSSQRIPGYYDRLKTSLILWHSVLTFSSISSYHDNIRPPKYRIKWYFSLAFNVGVKISTNKIPIVVVGECGDKFHQKVAFAEFTLSDWLDNFLQRCREIFLRRCDWHCVLKFVHFLHPATKDEYVLLPHLLVNLNICSIHCSDDEWSIQHKFHVAGAWSFCSGQRNMLR